MLSTKTTTEGLFDFSAVRPDTYRLEVHATGFADYAEDKVTVDPARQTSLPRDSGGNPIVDAGR